MASADQLEHEVEEARRQLTKTLAELRDRLGARQIAHEVFERARETSWTQRAVAVPLIAAGAGAIWALSRRKAQPFTPQMPVMTQAGPAPAAPATDVMAALLPILTHPWVMSAVLGYLASGKPQVPQGSPPSGVKGSLPPASPNSPSNDAQTIEPSPEAHARGRLADAPSEIPPAGWKDILLRIFNNISDHRVLSIAAGVTFYSLLALFPAIAALVSLYGLFADAGTIAGHLDMMTGVLPGGAIDVVREQLTRVSSQGQGTLGVTFAVSVLTSLWSANAGIKAFFDALNIIYGEQEKRNFFILNAISLLFTGASIVFLLIALGAIVVVPAVLNYVGIADTAEALLPLLRWPLLFFVTALALTMLYRYGPSRDKAQWRWVFFGAAVAALLWLGASILFSWYTAHFGNYNATYGSLGAVVGFMIWIWLSATVFLMGAELDAEAEHQTARDTTTGSSQPMGMRGARVADTLGAARA